MDTLENLTIKLRIEGDKNAHWECQKIEGNKIKTIYDLENKRDIICKRKIRLKLTLFTYII